ncbi:cytochrome c oxidase assembly protein COX11, mitochondrial-like isoform X2 [Liolophura sinensis]
MGTVTRLAFPAVGCWQNVNDRLLSRLLTRSLAHSFISKTFSSRTVTYYGKSLNTILCPEKCSYNGLKAKLLNDRPAASVSLRMFSSVLERDSSKHMRKLGCDTCQWQILKRCISESPKKADSVKRTTTVIYICAIGVFMVGASYAGVPLYRIFCQATGLGGQAVKGHDTGKIENMTPIKDRVISVRFNADVASSMQWNFRPQQSEVKVLPGETALAFYTAKNPTDKPIIGISTYNVIPFEAGQYFNKIQCFCFEEQRLNPHEQVDMPVFFFIDPEFAEDPKCAQIETIMLSYTFFEAKEGLELPYPGYAGSMYAKSAA